MNGRIYDYQSGRFLSVDPFISMPGSSQAYNPYSYVMNNPLSYTDPTGYIAESSIKFGLAESPDTGCDDACKDKRIKREERARKSCANDPMSSSCRRAQTLINALVSGNGNNSEPNSLLHYGGGGIFDFAKGVIRGGLAFQGNFLVDGMCTTSLLCTAGREALGLDTINLYSLDPEDTNIGQLGQDVGPGIPFSGFASLFKKTLMFTINIRSSQKYWRTFSDGTNQGMKHFFDYSKKFPDRLPSLERRLGLDVGTFSINTNGFKAFTQQARNVVKDGSSRFLDSGRSIHFMKGVDKSTNGTIVIMQNNKLQSMMPGTFKSFMKRN